jgi:hypothetical protein
VAFANLIYEQARHTLAPHVLCHAKMSQADNLAGQRVQRIPDNATIMYGCHQGASGGGVPKRRLGHETHRAPELISKRNYLAEGASLLGLYMGDLNL